MFFLENKTNSCYRNIRKKTRKFYAIRNLKYLVHWLIYDFCSINKSAIPRINNENNSIIWITDTAFKFNAY